MISGEARSTATYGATSVARPPARRSHVSIEISLVVPLRRGIEESGLPQIRLENIHVDLEAQARTVWHRHESPVDDRIVRLIRPFHPVEEGLVIGLMIFTRQELVARGGRMRAGKQRYRSEEHTSELQSRQYLVCRLLLEKK